jgi:hypothetical protein
MPRPTSMVNILDRGVKKRWYVPLQCCSSLSNCSREVEKEQRRRKGYKAASAAKLVAEVSFFPLRSQVLNVLSQLPYFDVEDSDNNLELDSGGSNDNYNDNDNDNYIPQVDWLAHTDLELQWNKRSVSLDLTLQTPEIQQTIHRAILHAHMKLIFGYAGSNPFTADAMKVMGYQGLLEAAEDYGYTEAGDIKDRLKNDNSKEYADPLSVYVSLSRVCHAIVYF